MRAGQGTATGITSLEIARTRIKTKRLVEQQVLTERVIENVRDRNVAWLAYRVVVTSISSRLEATGYVYAYTETDEANYAN